MEGGAQGNQDCAAWSDSTKEIVLVTLAAKFSAR
jgi:hypothetical protein